jgi:hypothetical protein
MPLGFAAQPARQASFSSYLIGTTLFFSRRFEEAAPRLRTAIEKTPAFLTSYRFLAACYADMRLIDEARATVAWLRGDHARSDGELSAPFRDPQHRELYFSGLRLAMGKTE